MNEVQSAYVSSGGQVIVESSDRQNQFVENSNVDISKEIEFLGCVWGRARDGETETERTEGREKVYNARVNVLH